MMMRNRGRNKQKNCTINNPEKNIFSHSFFVNILDTFKKKKRMEKKQRSIKQSLFHKIIIIIYVFIPSFIRFITIFLS